MHRMLTVKEVLIYQANLRLPSTISKEEKKRKVNEVKYKACGCWSKFLTSNLFSPELWEARSLWLAQVGDAQVLIFFLI